jgi:cytochrome P450
MTTTSATPLAYDPYDPETVRSPWAIYERLREESPVHFVRYDDVLDRGAPADSRFDGFHVLSRFDHVFAAARDTATFSSASGLSVDGGDSKALGLAPTIVMMDPPDHTAYRRLVSRGFTPRQVETLEPELRRFVRARLDALDAASSDGEADFVAAVARPVPSFVVATYLGVPEEDRAAFDGWTEAIVAGNASGDVLTAAKAAVIDLYGYFSELLERRRRDPGDDMVSTLVQSTLQGEAVRPEAILGYAFVMIAGGNDTATGLLGGMAELLTDHPDQRRRLLDDPALVRPAIDELLRLTSPVQGLSRQVTRDVEVGGVTLPAGSRAHLLYAAANRDPREFGPDAESFDVGRTIDRMMTFTSGPHYCLGAAAARLQGRVVLEELLARFPEFAVDGARGTYAPGAFVRRFTSLPFVPVA